LSTVEFMTMQFIYNINYISWHFICFCSKWTSTSARYAKLQRTRLENVYFSIYIILLYYL